MFHPWLNCLFPVKPNKRLGTQDTHVEVSADALLNPVAGTPQVMMRREFAGRGSNQNPREHFARDIREPEPAAVVGVGQPLVVDAELVQNRCVQVMDGDGITAALCPNSSVSPWLAPPWMPAPAIHTTKPCGL